MNNIFNSLLEGLEENAAFDEMRNLVNSILPVHKYKLLKRFLSSEERLSEEIRVNCLTIFLDKRTKFFSFVEDTDNQTTIKNILEIIPKYCPNIEIIDFSKLHIQMENKENFKTVLKQSTNMKSIRVRCSRNNSDAIFQLLLEDDFNLHEKDVQIGLLKIEKITGDELRESDCVQLLNLLPNLTCLGSLRPLIPLLITIREDDEIVQKLCKITEIYDELTRLSTLQRLIKFFPKAKKIYLVLPQTKVIENLKNFPLLTEITLIVAEYPDFFSELINLLKGIGKQIRDLNVLMFGELELDMHILHELCPGSISIGKLIPRRLGNVLEMNV